MTIGDIDEILHGIEEDLTQTIDIKIKIHFPIDAGRNGSVDVDVDVSITKGADPATITKPNPNAGMRDIVKRIGRIGIGLPKLRGRGHISIKYKPKVGDGPSLDVEIKKE